MTKTIGYSDYNGYIAGASGKPVIFGTESDIKRFGKVRVAKASALSVQEEEKEEDMPCNNQRRIASVEYSQYTDMPSDIISGYFGNDAAVTDVTKAYNKLVQRMKQKQAYKQRIAKRDENLTPLEKQLKILTGEI